MKKRRPPSFHWCDRRLMLLLQEYDQTELQMVWLFRYGTLLDVFGNATDEKIQ